MRTSARLALTSLAVLALTPSTRVYARPFRVAQVPNGAVAQCLTCHVYPGGPRNAFGDTIEHYGGTGFLDGPGGNVLWGSVAIADPANPSAPPKTLAELDSDGDGRSNGVELLDPTGTWRPGQADPGQLAAVRSPGIVDAQVVIRQVFAGGGSAGAAYQHDFVELFNRSSAAVSLAGWSLQAAPPTGLGNFGSTAATLTPLPSVTLQPGQSLLVQGAAGAGAGGVLPAPDVIDATPLALAETGGKLALVASTTPVACNGEPTLCTPAQLAPVIDLVGYGSATYYEGVAAASVTTATSSLSRIRAGCTDIGSSGSAGSIVGDFALGAVSPRSASSVREPCPGTVPPPAVPAVPRSEAWLLFCVAWLVGRFGRRRAPRSA